MTNDNVRTLRRRNGRQSRSSEPPRTYDEVPLSGRPDATVPTLPLNLADIGDPDLMTQFATYVAWQNFISVRFTEAEIHEATAETELKVALAEALVSSWTGAKEDRVAVARAERELDPTVRKLQDTYDTARAHRKMLGTLATNMERAAALLSRELTRRVGREPLERRAWK
jgi:hypothetical protein